MLSLLIPFATAFILSCVLTPLVIHGAHKAGFLDVPRDDRRAHLVPIPRLGGISVALACSLTLLGIWITGATPWDPFPSQYANLSIGLTIGATLLFTAGIYDDVRGISPRLKVIIQTAAAVLVVAYGLTPGSVALSANSAVWHAGDAIGGGVLIVWVVGITNAFNLIDGLDGLASSFALIALGAITCSTLVLHAGLSTMLPMIVVGSVLGFLRYNWSPARIFLGDAGSMTMGFGLAVLTVLAATDKRGVTYPIIPLCALAFPITDTVVAIARRWLRCVPLSQADGRHIHHQLRRVGLSTQQTVSLLAAVFGSVAVIGLLVALAPIQIPSAVLVIGIFILLFLLACTLQWMRYEEFSTLSSCIISAWRNSRRAVLTQILVNEAATRIRQTNSVVEIREVLNSLAEQVGLVDIELDETGRKDKLTPPSQQIAPVDALPMRLDYIFAVGNSAKSRIVLRVWGTPHKHNEPYSMERVAVRVGRALQSWYELNPAHIPEEHSGIDVRPKEGTAALD